MPTLHWIGKERVINHHLDVPFRVLEYKYIFDNGTQTEAPILVDKARVLFLGKHNDTAYYFHYEQNEVTTLDHAFLATMKIQAEQYVIYADNCLLTKAFMTRQHIIFKKIPRDITRF
jgi:adenine-specific DNA-methyltransferase